MSSYQDAVKAKEWLESQGVDVFPSRWFDGQWISRAFRGYGQNAGFTNAQLIAFAREKCYTPKGDAD